MFLKWKAIAVVLVVLAAVVGLCVVEFRCGNALDGNADVTRIKNDLAAGKKELRHQEAENLAALARDLRSLAQRYKANGEDKKAHRAIGAAQELDRKIRKLLEEAE